MGSSPEVCLMNEKSGINNNFMYDSAFQVLILLVLFVITLYVTRILVLVLELIRVFFDIGIIVLSVN